MYIVHPASSAPGALPAFSPRVARFALTAWRAEAREDMRHRGHAAMFRPAHHRVSRGQEESFGARRTPVTTAGVARGLVHHRTRARWWRDSRYSGCGAHLGTQAGRQGVGPQMSATVRHRRFRREIVLAARLQHPSIVPLIAAGDADGLPYFTMPFVDGESFRARLVRTGPLPAAESPVSCVTWRQRLPSTRTRRRSPGHRA